MGVSITADEMVRAILANEFDDLESIDTDVVDDIRAGNIDDWTRAVADSGLLMADTVQALASGWRADPELLVDALLDGADEVTRRRVKAIRLPRTAESTVVSAG